MTDKPFITSDAQGTGLARYEEACRALSDARSVDEAKDIRDKAEAMRVYARQAKNRELEVDAAEIRFRAERRIGEMMAADAEVGRAKAGQPKKNGSTPDPYFPPTLAEIGVDKHLADRARKYAAVPAADFEAKIAGWRDGCLDEQTRPMVDLLRSVAHVANNSGENEWYTPAEFIEAARAVLGGFDLDPASSEIANRTVQAERYFTIENDGLEQEWPIGRIWMNPPYAQPLISKFASRLAAEVRRGSSAVVLVNNATETEWFQALGDDCSALCFPQGRIRFVDTAGNRSGAPLQGQAILYFGDCADFFQAEFERFGFVMRHVSI